MADPFSITASAIGIAAFGQQLAQSVVKIKRFCEDVKNAPEELQDTLDQIENIGKIMARVGREQQRAFQDFGEEQDEETLVASLRLCQKAVGKIAKLAQGLQNQMKARRKWGAVKAVVKRRDLEALHIKLDRAKIDLHFAYSMFVEAKRCRDSERVREVMERQWQGRVQTIGGGDPEEDSQELAGTELVARPKIQSATYRTLTKRMNSTKATKLCLRLPAWLCQYTVDLLFVSSSGRWTTSLHVYRVLSAFTMYPSIPSVDDICWNGNVQAMASLLQNKWISIHDRFYHFDTDKSESLFNMAAFRGQTDLAQYLLEHGAETDWTLNLDYVSSGAYPVCYPFLMAQDDVDLEKCRRHAQLLLKDRVVDEPEGMKWLEALARSPSCRTIQDRFMVIFASNQISNVELFLGLFQDDTSDEELFNTRLMNSGRGETIFHLVVAQWVKAFVYVDDRLSMKSTLLQLSQVIGRGLKVGADPSTKNEDNITPFWRLIFWSILYRRKEAWNHAIIQTWLNCLADLGVRLMEYGQIEQKSFHSYLETSNNRTYVDSVLFKDVFVGMNYGPLARDWIVWFKHPGDIFAGIFWQLIENPETTIPGAWVDPDLVDAWYDDIPAKTHVTRRKKIRKMKKALKSASHLNQDISVDSGEYSVLLDLVRAQAR